MTDSFQESQLENSDLQLNGQNLEVYRFHCDKLGMEFKWPHPYQNKRKGGHESNEYVYSE